MKKSKSEWLLIVAGILLGVACLLFAHFCLVGCRVQQPVPYKSDTVLEVCKPDTTTIYN